MVEIFDNIRKLYRFCQPCDELTNYVEFFSESCAASTQAHMRNNCFTVKMFASWTPTFWINLGSAYNLAIGNRQQLVRPAQDVLVIRDGTVERINLPADHIFTVKFFPGCLEAIFGIKQSQMAGKVIPLYEIVPAWLLQQVRECNDFEERMKLLQDFMIQALKSKSHPDHYLHFVQQTIAIYEHGNHQYNVNEMAARLFTTSKTINRYFDRVIGITPKNYFSILRARVALTGYVQQRRSFDPCHYGYYDMSHFYKEVVKFTGQKLTGNHI